ncbi:MAG: hypothetical protein IH935_11475, partial [Acidobacteria bacterium]|nr:hypothetical protein [Acidobacteriota bacterium]
VFIDPVSPGIFTIPSGGEGPGAILHADGSLVTSQNPAAPGEVIVIFCTGLGEVDPPLASGIPAGLHRTVTPVTVTIDGVPAAVQFDGMAPGFVGLYQVNAVVPASTRTSDDIPIVLTIGGRQSNPGKTVTIAVLEEGGVPPGGGGGAEAPVDGNPEDGFLDDDDDDDDTDPLDDEY